MPQDEPIAPESPPGPKQPNVKDPVFPTLVRATECLSHHPYFRDRGAHGFSFSRQRSGTATIAYRFEAAFAQTRKSYWLKIYRSNPKDALKEWQFLNEAMAGVGANRPLPMARPIAYLGEFAALVTEHAEGEMLAGRSRHFLQDPGGPAGGVVHIIHPFPGMGFSRRAVSQPIDLPGI